MTTFFNGIFDTSTTTSASLGLGSFLICIAVSLAIGFFLAWAYSYKSRHTSSFLLTVALLPAIVCVVIMMVNGNIGAGIAVAGAFSLVRFRSVPGTAKEIATIFLAMGTGLITGMGYLGYAVVFALILGCLMVAFNLILTGKTDNSPYVLRIMVPEDLNYTELFEEPLEKYTDSHNLTAVKTANMGSLYRLTYDIQLKKDHSEKELIDSLRERNGNLEIGISRGETPMAEL